MIKESVKHIPFFSRLNDAELQEIVEAGQERTLASGQLVFEQGDPGDYMYVIIEGRVRIFHKTEEEEITLSTLEKGSFFGEMALIDDGPRSASVQTLVSCELFVLGRAEFLELLGRSAHMIADVMRGLSAKIRVLGQDFVVTSLQKRHIEDQAEIDRHRAISQMVAGVAHEINTPIGIASQGARFISDTLTPALMARLAEDGNALEALNDVVDAAQLVEANIQRADRLIRSFKSLSVRQNSDSLEKVDLRELLDEIVVLYPVQSKSANLTIDINEHLGDDRVWMGYPGYLTQVLLNLIMNAQVHAYPADSGGSVEIVLTENMERYIVEVKDFGCGISEEDLKEVFTAFYTTKRGQGGAGLGMAIVHSLVTNSLQGTIDMDSEVGRGTSVVIRFPKQLKV